ncbi:sugar ABC transporter permease [Alsobacter metallidurans]|uniref:Xylose transport system permease protein XylH n=1 Tax=Alsobacter metallidurans TaxID=340221 RepID=A0A917IAI5_9HYPH|nr:multiple monosaccharide ABC transporter permease [Alsobacter metallidurans]GGH30973.1 sugar ABC transporter permease [Alsobacter metallidurans]
MTEATSAPTATPVGAGTGTSWKSHIREYGLLGSLLVIMVFFQIMTDGVLLQPVNITNLIQQNSYIVIMALGMLFVIVGGNIDLSVGSIVGFVGAIAALLMVGFTLPGTEIFIKVHWFPVILLSLALGGLIGAAQGWFVAYAAIPAFIVTLGGMLIFRGLTGNMLAGQFVGPFANDFQNISKGFIPEFITATAQGFKWTSMLLGAAIAAALFAFDFRKWSRAGAQEIDREPAPLFIGKNLVFAALILGVTYLLASYRGLPVVLVIMGALILFYNFVTTRTVIGRRIYALGGNAQAARLSGIKTQRLAFLTFVNMGVLAGLAGLIVAARLNSATPSAGNSFELDVIAACFIGGVSASGGAGRVMGVVIGAFFMGIMNNGMSILGIGIFWQQVVKGFVLLAAVYLDVYNKSK